MQQEHQGIGARIKILRSAVILFSLLFIFSNVFAQNDEFEFQMNFIKTFKYPESLRRSCSPTFTNILVDVSERGTIQNISISDSAPKFFKDESLFKFVIGNLL